MLSLPRFVDSWKKKKKFGPFTITTDDGNEYKGEFKRVGEE